MGLATEYPFVLPRGYVDPEGTVHRRGVMRLATARDEIEPLRDARIQGPDDPYLTIIVLSRVLTELGSLSSVSTREIEGLFAADLAFLQDLYGVINFGNDDDIRDFLAEAAATEPPAAAVGDRIGEASGDAPDADAVPDRADSSDDTDGVQRRRGGGMVEEVTRTA